MKVLIVEDDYIVRKGIVLSLDWEAYGLQICGEAANGAQGFERVKELKPEIVITDIKMPIADGLHLAGRIKEYDPAIQVIILSGYEDFAYARQAMKLGVREYLLKPVNADELLQIVTRMKEEIGKERVLEEAKRAHAELIEENRMALRDQYLNRMLMDTFQEEQEQLTVIRKCNQLGTYFQPGSFQVLLLSVDDFLLFTQKNTEEEREAILKILRDRIEEQFARYHRAIVCMTMHMQFVIIRNQKESNPTQYQKDLHDLREKLQEELGLLLTAAIGTVKPEIEKIPQSYQEAVSALRSRPYLQNEWLILYTPKMQSEKPTFLDVKEEERALIHFLQQYEAKKASQCVQGILEEAQLAQKSFEKVKSVCVRLLVIAISNLEEMSVSQNRLHQDLSVSMDMIRRCETFRTLKQYMAMVFQDIEQVLLEVETEKYSGFIRKAVRYIEKHYSEEIRIEHLVAELYITPNYFSQIFKSQMGTNFVDYLNQFRVERAKELLNNMDLKVYQISELCGYQNYKYFNQVFKKYTGFSPKEYRNLPHIREKES